MPQALTLSTTVRLKAPGVCRTSLHNFWVNATKNKWLGWVPSLRRSVTDSFQQIRGIEAMLEQGWANISLSSHAGGLSHTVNVILF